MVLGYIQNNTKRFKIFVANRIHQIHESCRVEQWIYLRSKLYPADHASGGLGIAEAEGQGSTWIHGPKFLWQKENTWPKQDSHDICEEHPEVKHSLKTNLTSSRTASVIHFFHRRAGHGGRGMTVNEIRSNGFWVINCTAAMKSMILKCVDSRKLHGKT